MTTPRIAFIGAGNMATSLIGGLVNGGHPPTHVNVADPDRDRLSAAAQSFNVQCCDSNAQAVEDADVVVFAVKPQIMSGVVRDVAAALADASALVLSVAAGVRSVDIERWLGHRAAIVRTMPNTPALLRQGATGLFANTEVSSEQRRVAEQVMGSVGITIWVDDEPALDAVTAVSGSGPAYYFLLMEMMVRAGESLGLTPETARALTLQTALGAARMALESGDDPATLRRNVTSPGGTTERAVNSFLEQGLEHDVLAALTAARDRAVELGDLLGKE